MKISAVITCAGKGERARQSKNKLLSLINGKTVFETTLTAFSKMNFIDEIIITYSPCDLVEFKNISDKIYPQTKFIKGGETRFDSVYEALKVCLGDIVLIHDGARPFIDENTVLSCIESVKQFGSGVTCVPVTDTLAKVNENGNIAETFRKGIVAMQTPQAFLLKDILKAYENCSHKNFTDDAGVYCNTFGYCKTVNGFYLNKKLTYPEDFEESFIGTGFDLHRLSENRKLILGGIIVPSDKGLLGHSDADVLTHAVMDALLSAAHLRDIGYHFSDKDEKYKDISSMILLEKVMKMLKGKGFKPQSVSAVIMAEKPKLSPYVETISKNLAVALNLPVERVGITCTTLEGIGTVGREEGIAVQAYCKITNL